MSTSSIEMLVQQVGGLEQQEVTYSSDHTKLVKCGER